MTITPSTLIGVSLRFPSLARPTTHEAIAYVRNHFASRQMAVTITGTLRSIFSEIRTVSFIWEGHRYVMEVWQERPEDGAPYLYGEW